MCDLRCEAMREKHRACSSSLMQMLSMSWLFVCLFVTAHFHEYQCYLHRHQMNLHCQFQASHLPYIHFSYLFFKKNVVVGEFSAKSHNILKHFWNDTAKFYFRFNAMLIGIIWNFKPKKSIYHNSVLHQHIIWISNLWLLCLCASRSKKKAARFHSTFRSKDAN